VNDAMTLEQVKAEIAKYEYPMVGVTEAQLIARGYAKADINLDTLATAEEVEALDAVGLSAVVVRPDPQYARKRPPAR